MTTLELLQKSLLFKGSSKEELELALGLLQEHQVKPNTTIFSEGMAAEALYLIKSGNVTVSMKKTNGEEMPLFQLGPGEFFGELALLQQEKRMVTAKTDTPAEIVVMTRKDFHGLIDLEPRNGARVLMAVAKLLVMRIAAYGHRFKELL